MGCLLSSRLPGLRRHEPSDWCRVVVSVCFVCLSCFEKCRKCNALSLGSVGELWPFVYC